MRLVFAFALVMSLLASTGCSRRKEVWIYTSIPKEVIAEMVEPLQAAIPQADVKWFQSGSDNVANRLHSEVEEEEVKADLVLTSDPFWYFDMKKKGLFLQYDSPAAREVPAFLRDPDHMFTTVRVPVMVMAYNAALVKQGEIPERWKDLASARFERKFSMASPLDSPSSFTVLAMLSKLYGWEFFGELRRLGVVAEGTNSSVLTRIETGERPIGALPLDTALRASVHSAGIKAVFPQDGVMPVPGSIAILKSTGHPEVAQKVYDWFFTSEAQKLIVKSGSYSPLPKMPSPEGARPWSELQSLLTKWAPETLAEMVKDRDRIRAKFSEVVLH